MEKVLFLDSPMKEKLYGSRRIQEKFGLGPMDKKIGEYWAISAHDNGLSKIKNGKYKGETLKDVKEITENYLRMILTISFLY